MKATRRARRTALTATAITGLLAAALAGCGGGGTSRSGTGNSTPVTVTVPQNDNGVTLGLDTSGPTGGATNIVLGPDGHSDGPQGSPSLLHGSCTGTTPNTTITVTSNGDSPPYDGWTAVFHQNDPDVATVTYTPTAADIARLAQNNTIPGKGQPGTKLTQTIHTGTASPQGITWTVNPPGVQVNWENGSPTLPANWYTTLGATPIPTDSGAAYSIALQFNATCAT